MPNLGTSLRRKSVLIVDDSAAWRRWLRAIIEQDPRLYVVGEAGSAEKAREIIKTTNPDVLTLDIQMPGMNGLRFLEHLMRLRPMPVIMFSGHTSANSAESVRALSLGAIDCFLKTGNFSEDAINDLRRRVFAAAQCAPQRISNRASAIEYGPAPSTLEPPIMLIGASTGGVLALERTLMPLPASTPPIVIVQHMPAPFLSSFARRLNGLLPHRVRLAEANMALGRGDIVLAPTDGLQTGVSLEGGQWRSVRLPANPDDVFTPSVDRLFLSAAARADRVVAAVLTGIGVDGALGAGHLARGGATVLTQSAESCVVFGMPRAVQECVPDSISVPLIDMGRQLIKAVQRVEARSPA